jgi:hypothetical protein
MIEIVEITNSPKNGKRYRIVLNIDGKDKHWDFGAEGGSTYIDHADPVKRANYIKRHLANPTERQRIMNAIPSSALFSMVLLWGPSPDLTENIVVLQKMLNK